MKCRFFVLLKNLLLRLDSMNVSWKSVEDAIKRATKMITDHERFLSEVRRTGGQGLQGVRSEYKSLEVTSPEFELNEDKEVFTFEEFQTYIER